MQNVFVSWSGGKDSCYALYKAARNGLDAKYLVNMMDDRGEWSFTHRLAPELLKKQAEALGIPILLKQSTSDSYGADFIETIRELKAKGIEGGVFGDMDIEPHREWEENMCREGGVACHLPLWKMDQNEVMDDFLNLGFEATVVVTQGDKLGSEYLGRTIDRAFLEEMKEKGVTPCGELGEFHTIVTDGPLFRKKLEITGSEVKTNMGYWFLEVRGTRLAEK